MVLSRYGKILDKVRKPGRYVGHEVNSRRKTGNGLRFCLAFPDLYEIGMSHLGIQILYGILNGIEDVSCERLFVPDIDFEKELGEFSLPLLTLESGTPVSDFHCIGFSLQYELSYTNILTVLNLAGIPFFSRDRNGFPLIIGGGPSASNPEPVADFFDFFLIGDGEEVLPIVIEKLKCFIDNGNFNKNIFLKEISSLQGIYVPSFYEIKYGRLGEVKSFSAKNGAPHSIEKAIVRDYDNAYFPKKPVIPLIKAIHERGVVEVMRGCPHKCKYCHASRYYHPVRVKNKDTIFNNVFEVLKNTGYDEIALLSLTSGDYPGIEDVLQKLNEYYCSDNVSFSLPSLRVEKMVKNLPFYLSNVRKSGLTFAPEAGTERLRKHIGKNINIDNLKKAVYEAFKKGYRHVKLYFMIGLPTETYDDLDGIADLVYEIAYLRKKLFKRPANINAGISTFIPKPHTPFESEPMNSMKKIKEKQAYLSKKLRRPFVKYGFTDPRISILESALSRGDRRLSAVIADAWNNGARLDGWGEYFNYDVWNNAFSRHGINIENYAVRNLREMVRKPWVHIKIV